MYEYFITCQSEEKYIWNWSKTLGIACLFNLWINVNEEYNLMSDCAFGPFTYACYKNCMSGFSAFVLNVSKSGNIFFGVKWKLSVQLSIIFVISRRDNSSLVHELWVTSAVEQNVNATYYAQNLALKSFYGKDPSVIAGKLISS